MRNSRKDTVPWMSRYVLWESGRRQHLYKESVIGEKETLEADNSYDQGECAGCDFSQTLSGLSRNTEKYKMDDLSGMQERNPSDPGTVLQKMRKTGGGKPGVLCGLFRNQKVFYRGKRNLSI